MKEKIYNKKSGITLIALVITIIVLLILAGITIGVLVGDNGIITRSIKSEEETKKTQYEELINIIIVEKKIERSQNPREEDPLIKSVADSIDKKEWSKMVTICDEYGKSEVEVEKCNRIIVQTKDGYEIIVKLDNENLTGEVVSITKGTTPTWKVTFEANGGSGEVPKAMEIKKGFSIKLPEGERLTQTDQKIVGWSKVKKPENEKDKIYTIGSSYQPTEEQTTLYAIWAEDTVTISFDKNQGEDKIEVEGEMNQITVGSGKTTMLPNNTFTKYGYRLKEWNTKKEGDGISYPDGGEIKVSQDTTLYAIWEEDISATLNVTNNKFTEGSKIALGATAIAHGIEKIELRVENHILYEENMEENKTTYSKSNLGLDQLKQEALFKLSFNDITLQLAVTSTTGKVKNTNVNIKNYTIGNNDSLRQFAQVVNNGNPLKGETIIQLTHLGLGATDAPIGLWMIDSEEGNPFSGVYDGKGYSIQQAQNRVFYKEYAKGIFGYIENATIKNLTVHGALNEGDYSGGICGTAWSSTFFNCCFGTGSFGPTNETGTVKAGIVAYAGNCTIERCCCKTTISGTECIGGIVGWLIGDGSKINSCYNLRNIQSNGKNEYGYGDTGGLIGSLYSGNKNSEISNCYNAGDITGAYPNVGGLFGVAWETGARTDVKNCYNVGNVICSDSSRVGPLHGIARTLNYYNSYHIIPDSSWWDGCTWDDKTREVSANELKTMAGTLGSAYKSDNGQNGGFPILTWQ